MSRLTTKQVCDAINKKTGLDVKLHRDPSGYFYFYADDKVTNSVLQKLPSTSVYVYRLNHLNLYEWVREFDLLLKGI